MEMDPETLFKLLAQLEKLNENMAQSRAATLTLIGSLKDMKDNAKVMLSVAKQVNILNQILLQIGKKAGMAGMLEKILTAVVTMARRGG